MNKMSQILLLVIVFTQNSAIAANLSYGIVGDMGRWNANAELVRDSMVRMNTKNLIMPGDNLYKESQGYTDVWSPWSSKGFVFSYTAIGNHHSSYEDEVAFFKMPGEYFASVDQEKDIRFIVLNSDNEDNVEKQMAFLREQLSTSKNKFNFIMYHHPSFTVSDHHKWEERRKFQKTIRDIVKKNKNVISGLIWGHDHLAATFDFEGVPVFLSGSAESPRLGIVQPENLGFQFEDVWLATPGQPYWLQLEALAGDRNGLVFKYIRARDDHVMCTMKLVAPNAMSYQPDCQIKLSRDR
jgi:predicted phosphodiesterase